MTPHLSHEQLCDILLARSPRALSSDFAALQDHLSICSACATELADLRISLSIFRDASTSYARQQLTHVDTRKFSSLSQGTTFFQPVYRAIAATLLLAATLPFGLHRQPPSPPPSSSATASAPAHTIQSDEALLEEISQELAAPIPSPMRPLADPTASSDATQSTSPKRNN